MPKIDFSHIEDVQDFQPLPDGEYLCRLSEIVEASTNQGDEMWKLRFEVIKGEYEGRYIFDNLVFSEAALKRVKLVCSRLGLDVSGEVDLTPDMLEDRTCFVITEIEEYEDAEGRIKRRNVIPFAGYERADTAAAESPESEEDDGEESLPF